MLSTTGEDRVLQQIGPVLRKARRLGGQYPSFSDDFESGLVEALIRANEAYDPSFGVDWKLFLWYRIGYAAKEILRVQVRRVRKETSAFRTYSMYFQASYLGKRQSPLDRVSKRELKGMLLVLIAELPTNERMIVEECLLGDVEQQVIADRLGVTQGRISQLKKQAISRLEHRARLI